MTDNMTTKPDNLQLDRARILGIPAILMALLFSITWIAAVLAYGWGFFDMGSKALNSPSSWGIAPHIIAAFVVLAILPVAFIWMTVITLGRAATMTRAANDLARAARRLTNPVTYMGDGARTVIAELDQEFERLKSEVSTIDQMLGETHERIAEQVSLLKDAGEAAGEQASNLQMHLGQERQALQELARMIGNEGSRISSILDGTSPGIAAEPRPETSLDTQNEQETGQELKLGISHATPPAPTPDDNLEIITDQETPESQDADTLDLPQKLTPIEELSNYIGKHQSARQETKEETEEEPQDEQATDPDPHDESETIDIPPLIKSILKVDIKEDEPDDDVGTPYTQTGPSLVARSDINILDTSELKVVREEEESPAAHSTTEQTTLDPLRSALSLSRRIDRARLPVDLRTNIDGLHALSIDLNRLLSTSPPADLWRRYMNGEREVFTEHLLIWKETAEDDDVESTAASETFQRYAERFRRQFDDTIKLARMSEAGSEAVTEIKSSDINLVNDMLLDLDRRTP